MDDLITLDDRLRMVPADAVALQRSVEELRGATDAASRRRLGLGLIALGNYSEAVVILDGVVTDAASNRDSDTEIKARINLGDAFRYHGDLRAAYTEYQRAVKQARAENQLLLDFALQHLGKHYLEAGQRSAAITCFWEALRLRRAKGDASLVDSTLAALALAGQTAT